MSRVGFCEFVILLFSGFWVGWVWEGGMGGCGMNGMGFLGEGGWGGGWGDRVMGGWGDDGCIDDCVLLEVVWEKGGEGE